MNTFGAHEFRGCGSRCAARAYLHVLVPGDLGQLVHGQDVEALAENSPLDLDGFTVSG